MECIIRSAPIDEVQLLSTSQSSYETVINVNDQERCFWQLIVSKRECIACYKLVLAYLDTG